MALSFARLHTTCINKHARKPKLPLPLSSPGAHTSFNKFNNINFLVSYNRTSSIPNEFAAFCGGFPQVSYTWPLLPSPPLQLPSQLGVPWPQDWAPTMVH